MQTLFTLESNKFVSLQQAENMLHKSVDEFVDFYNYIIYTTLRVTEYLNIDAEIKANKFLPTEEDEVINAKMLENQVIVGLQHSTDWDQLVQKAKFPSKVEEHIIRGLYQQMIKNDQYQAYLTQQLTDFKDDIQILKNIVFQVILPNEVFVEHLGDLFIHRDDDGLDVEKLLQKRFKRARQKNDSELLFLQQGSKFAELKQFGSALLHKTVDHSADLTDSYKEYLRNWDVNRLAILDTVLLKMALCELLYFPEIPIKVTMNEYIEVSKEYSTPKSKEFINGVLDKMMKDFTKAGKIVKTGRGLIN